VNVVVPIVMEPVRDVDPAFAATFSVVLPDPLPAAPVVTVTHESLLTDVHAHPAAAVIVAVTDPPAPLNDWVVGDTVGGHGKLGTLKAKVFERALGVVPPGPTALTTAS
jgi:hypothetical protein